MSALHPNSALPAPGTGDSRPPLAWEDHSARFTARSDSSGIVVVAHGELDASNAIELADFVEQCVEQSTSVAVDLSGLKFFGTAGFSALHLINVRCAGANQRWAVVPSRAVSRLLGICDPDHTLPVIQSVDAFRDAHDDGPQRLFQLVP